MTSSIGRGCSIRVRRISGPSSLPGTNNIVELPKVEVGGSILLKGKSSFRGRSIRRLVLPLAASSPGEAWRARVSSGKSSHQRRPLARSAAPAHVGH
jgi:hypothetical protein